MKKVKNSRNYLTKTCEQFEKNVKQQIKESKARCGWLRTSTKKKEEASGGGTTAGDTVCWILKIRSVAVGSTQWSTNWFNLNTLVHGGKGIRRKTCASGSGTAAGQTALNPNNPNQTGWNCGHKFAVPPFPPKKKVHCSPPMKTTTCHVCHAGTLAAPFYMKDLGPSHLGHAVGMTHAGTFAASVPMKFLNMCGTLAAPV